MSERADKATAMVFGAARAFGREIVAQLAADGYRVIALDATLPALDSGIADATAMRLDATDPEAVANLFALERAVEVVVLNAPVSAGHKRFVDITDAELDAALAPAVVEPVCVVHGALGALRPGGRIVLVASRAHLGAWGGAHVMAAGAAAVTMSRVMAVELEKPGIRINMVAPEFIEEVTANPAGPRQVATIVGFLASASSAPISGETLLVNAVKSLQLRESVRQEMS